MISINMEKVDLRNQKWVRILHIYVLSSSKFEYFASSSVLNCKLKYIFYEKAWTFFTSSTESLLSSIYYYYYLIKINYF